MGPVTWRRSFGGWSRRLLAAALLTTMVGAWSTGAAGAAPAPKPKPSIDVLTATPSVVDPHGGTITVRVTVKHAARCAFRGQKIAFAAVKLLRTIDCSSGRASLKVPIKANTYKHAITLHFSVTASDTRSHSDYGQTEVIQAAKEVAPKQIPVPPLAVSTKAVPGASLDLPYSVTLAATGGTAPYNLSLIHI